MDREPTEDNPIAPVCWFCHREITVWHRKEAANAGHPLPPPCCFCSRPLHEDEFDQVLAEAKKIEPYLSDELLAVHPRMCITCQEEYYAAHHDTIPDEDEAL